MYKSMKGFTLAEVLITLLIIGVVASIVIPALITDIQDQQYKVAYKKAWADATTVWKSMDSQNLITYSASLYDPNAEISNFDQFKQYFNKTQGCLGYLGNMGNCWSLYGEDYQTGYSTNSATSNRAFIDNSGRAWLFTTAFAGLIINVDTNGFSPPNKYGKDRFFIRAVRKEAQSPEEANDNNGCPGTPSSCKGEGLYQKLFPDIDRTIVGTGCHYPPCYGKSWLLN